MYIGRVQCDLKAEIGGDATISQETPKIARKTPASRKAARVDSSLSPSEPC
jgi:hypothetical protein